MSQAQASRSFGDARRFVAGQFLGLAARDGAETTRSRAHIAQDHEGRGLLRVALHAIGTLGIITYGLEFQFVEQAAVKLPKLPLGSSRLSQGGNRLDGSNSSGAAAPQLPPLDSLETTGNSKVIRKHLFKTSVKILVVFAHSCHGTLDPTRSVLR